MNESDRLMLTKIANYKNETGHLPGHLQYELLKIVRKNLKSKAK